MRQQWNIPGKRWMYVTTREMSCGEGLDAGGNLLKDLPVMQQAAGSKAIHPSCA